MSDGLVDCSKSSPYREAWKRSTLENFEQYPQENGSIFLFNPYTGEAVYDVDCWGEPLPDARKFAHWFQPTTVVSRDGYSLSGDRSINTNNLRDLVATFGGNEYRARWHSAEVIQRNLRAALARWRVARALLRTWIRQYDHDADRYSFTHQITKETQYHKPWGMRMADLWALPEEQVDARLLSLFLGIELNPFSSSNPRDDVDVAALNKSTIGDEGTREIPRTWEASKKQRHQLYRFYREQSFSAGPHCRICGPGSLRETSFTNVFVYPKKYYRVTPFSHPRDRQFEGTKMWTFVTCLDKLVEKKITADPYFHIRNASEHGALSVLKIMFKHRENLEVQGVGLQRMAGSLLEEDEAGGATEGQKKYLDKALELLRMYPDVEWIQAEACAALASMTSGLCVRKEMDREHSNWLEDVVAALMGVKSITQVVKEIDPAGKETRYDVRVPSPMAHLIALYGCRTLANMACDELNRATVARSSVAAVIHVARLITDDSVLACAVSAAVYNFVSRMQVIHQVVVEAGSEEALKGMLENLDDDDRKEREMITRAITALQPDGWRGIDHGLRDEDIPVPQGDSSASLESSRSSVTGNDQERDM